METVDADITEPNDTAAAGVQALVEPITLARAKAHLRVVVADDDEYITALIIVARQMVEGRTHRALVPRNEVTSLHRFPHGALYYFPHHDNECLSPVSAPLQSVVSIEYLAQDGTLAAVDPAIYRVNANVTPARVTLKQGQHWPSALHEDGAVTVTWRVGYTDPDSVPAPLKQWMLLAVGAMYENRDQVAVLPKLAYETIPDDFMGLLWQPYMVYT